MPIVQNQKVVIYLLAPLFFIVGIYLLFYTPYTEKILRTKELYSFETVDIFQETEVEVCPNGDCNFSERLRSCLQEEKWNALSTFSFNNNTFLLPVDKDLSYCVYNSRRKSKNYNSTTTFGLLPMDKKLKLDFVFNKTICNTLLDKSNCKVVKCQNNIFFRFVTLSDEIDYWKGPPCNSKSLPGQPLHEFAFRKFSLQTVEIEGLTIKYPLDTFLFRKHLEYSRFFKCNRTLAKIVKEKYPSYYNVTPKLNNESFRYFTMLRDVLQGYRITSMLVGGTLLGWARECGIIPHTGDFDVIVPAEEYNEHLEQLLQNHEELKLRYRFNKIDDFLEYGVKDPSGKTRMDIFFLYREKNHSFFGGIGYGSRPSKLKFTFAPLRGVCSAELLGRLFHIPCNYEDYIRGEYGDDWREPITEDNYLYSRDSVGVSVIKYLTKEERDRDYFKYFS